MSKASEVLHSQTFTYGSSLNWISSDFPIPLAFPRHSRQTEPYSQPPIPANGRYLVPELTSSLVIPRSRSMKELSCVRNPMARSTVYRERWRCRGRKGQTHFKVN